MITIEKVAEIVKGLDFYALTVHKNPCKSIILQYYLLRACFVVRVEQGFTFRSHGLPTLLTMVDSKKS